MARPDLKPHLDRLVATIGTKSTYHGQRISPSVMKLVFVEMRKNGGGVVAPYWFGVTQRGRGVRKSNVDHGLVNKIYGWMERHHMFTAKTPEGRASEARGLTWYINKYGNAHFRSGQFIDVYKSAREQCVRDVEAEYAIAIDKITQDIL
jgi:hypothetical protein